MKKKGRIRRIIIYIVLIIVAIVLIYALIKKGKVKLYKDESTTGNTSCNLLNGGLFCESDDTIYFANPYDNNTLYKMDSDLTNVEKLYSDCVSYINAAGNFLFYTRRNDKLNTTGDAILSLSTTGLFRLNTNGESLGRLYEDPTQVACLYGNYVYYQHYDQKKGLQLYSAKIDGSSDTQLLDEAAAPYAVSNNTIYYTGWDNDHNIHSMNINGSGEKTIYEGNCTSLSKQGDYLYFMDMSQNYALCRIGLDGGSPEVVVNDQLATYNISNDGSTIYYQVDNGNSNGLYRLDTTSGISSLISSGDYNYLHVISDYLFYESYDGKIAYVFNTATDENTTFEPKVSK